MAAPNNPLEGRPHQVSLPQEIVGIGGGTGLSMFLSGLSPYLGEGLTGVVNTFDDGGGTGRLRDAYSDLAAVGDARQCLDALSAAPDGLRRVLNHRFREGTEDNDLWLHGQTQGNLFIAAAIHSELAEGGTLASALAIVGDVFKVRGKVVPASNDNRRLRFDLLDGSVIEGEHNAEETKIPSLKGANIGFNAEQTDISEEAEAAIKSADIVVLAPGDLYTSLAPTLAVRGMKEALQAARVVMMVSNLMNRDRHTVGFTTLDYVQEYTRIIGARVIERVIYNTERLDKVALQNQAQKGSHQVRPNVKGLRNEGYTVRGYDLVSRETVKIDPNDAIGASRSEIRHDPAKLAAALIGMYLQNGFS